MKEKDWPDHLAKGYIAIEGAPFSLAHLQPFTYQVVIQPPSKEPVAVSVQVEFSSHCLTSSPA
ncbi:hypothetical protein [Xanthomonas vasicola]|uniref:Uncharacterized protein n=2 Tax=Xanthomonas vasicola TaxID=56459 RepID=A0A836ZSG5_XANVA|nr:hypothetical protein [Xanthomonas vasicola]MBV6748657.1 hypothetical protein [Xanthomonas vasicola pv. vasculorum NCPPB 890]MDO6950239.1 hypothetical protein [Xanthomonas vasicola]MDO6962308.1 hypothetical protein [Xanthomonas vasicola]